MPGRRERFGDDLSTLRTMGGAEDRPTDDLVMRVVQQSIVSARDLPRSGALVIGRSEGVDLRIDDPSVSRRHARLDIGPKLTQLTLQDLGSANGTKIAGRRLAPEQRVEFALGDVIELGSVMIVIRRRGASQRREAAQGSRAVVEEGGLQRLLRDAQRIAAGTISVLLRGETGVGKEIVADAIHRMSPRAKRPLLRLNCAAFSESLLISELFGHERGAFSGADHVKPGLLETANGGTVLLDEVGELPMGLQAKLLRVFEERAVLRVGALKPRPIDVRFIAATNRDLEAEIVRGTFRQDLFFRLNGFQIIIPPLRERRDEVGPLARTFVHEVAAQMGHPPPELTDEALAVLEQHPWPGNVRELRNVIERAVLLAADGRVEREHLALGGGRESVAHRMATVPAPPAPLHDEASIRGELAAIERRRVLEALASCAGNQTQAAKLLGISRGTLLARLDAFGFPRPRKRAE
jgi:two-component system response regulator AtoC